MPLKVALIRFCFIMILIAIAIPAQLLPFIQQVVLLKSVLAKLPFHPGNEIAF
jgi:hypothetical protein